MVLKSIVARFRLVYNEVVYWAIGDTPEAHHANAAYLRYTLGHHRKCIEQCTKFLSYSQSDQVQTMLGYSHGAIQNWEEAALAYRSVSGLWEKPMIALGLAEAELRAGNTSEARMIAATIEVNHAQPTYDVALALDQLKKELEESNSEAKGS